jgi:hypothetical protein
MKKVILTGMLLGLLTGASVAQRGRPAGPVSPTARPNTVSPTARPDVDMSTRRSPGASPTVAPGRTTVYQPVNPTAAPIRDPQVGASTTVAPNGTTTNRNVSPTAAPIQDPVVGGSATAVPDSRTVNRNVDPTAAPPIQDPKIQDPQ